MARAYGDDDGDIAMAPATPNVAATMLPDIGPHNARLMPKVNLPATARPLQPATWGPEYAARVVAADARAARDAEYAKKQEEMEEAEKVRQKKEAAEAIERLYGEEMKLQTELERIMELSQDLSKRVLKLVDSGKQIRDTNELSQARKYKYFNEAKLTHDKMIELLEYANELVSKSPPPKSMEGKKKIPLLLEKIRGAAIYANNSYKHRFSGGYRRSKRTTSTTPHKSMKHSKRASRRTHKKHQIRRYRKHRTTRRK